MKYLTCILAICFLAGCNGGDTTVVESNEKKDSSTTQLIKDSTAVEANEAEIFKVSDDVLRSLKEKNYKRFSEFIHPTEGIRFSPYVYIDTTENKKFSKAEFLSLLGKQTKLNWGAHDAGEDSIYMNLNNYFDRFVYDADFSNAEKKSYNKSLSSGTMPSNLEQVYPSAFYIEYYFPGFEKKYDGMDWKSLKLVFKKYGESIFLIAIVHGEWTT